MKPEQNKNEISKSEITDEELIQHGKECLTRMVEWQEWFDNEATPEEKADIHKRGKWFANRMQSGMPDIIGPNPYA